MIEGLLIAIEGVDGAGTTTHTRLLADKLRARGLLVHTTREPSDGPVGMLLRQILTGRVVVPGISGTRPPNWTTLALLFAADRLDHLESEVRPNMMDGVTVITDRYDHSSVAYQAITGGGEAEVLEWVKQLNRYAQRPDLTIVLDIAPQTAAKRRLDRTGGREIYDHEDLQQSLASFYSNIDQHFPGDRIAHVDADRPVEDVAADVYEHVKRVRGESG